MIAIAWTILILVSAVVSVIALSWMADDIRNDIRTERAERARRAAQWARYPND